MKIIKVREITPVIEKIASAMDVAKIEYNALDVARWPEHNNGYSPNVRFRIAYSSDEIYLHFDVEERDVKAVYGEDAGSNPYKDSCVEFFFSPHCNDNYYNLELNCIGKGTFAFRTGGKKGPKRQFGEDVLGRIRRYASLGTTPFGTKKGEDGTMQRWSLEVAIPLDCLAPTPLSPLKGRRIAANFYKCGDEMPSPHYLTWNMIDLEVPNFHRTDFFGILEFI